MKRFIYHYNDTIKTIIYYYFKLLTVFNFFLFKVRIFWKKNIFSYLKSTFQILAWTTYIYHTSNTLYSIKCKWDQNWFNYGAENNTYYIILSLIIIPLDYLSKIRSRYISKLIPLISLSKGTPVFYISKISFLGCYVEFISI